jgi:hypothetical protein
MALLPRKHPKKNITVCLLPATIELLRNEAARSGMAQTQIVTAALELYVNREEWLLNAIRTIIHEELGRP